MGKREEKEDKFDPPEELVRMVAMFSAALSVIGAGGFANSAQQVVERAQKFEAYVRGEKK